MPNRFENGRQPQHHGNEQEIPQDKDQQAVHVAIRTIPDKPTGNETKQQANTKANRKQDRKRTNNKYKLMTKQGDRENSTKQTIQHSNRPTKTATDKKQRRM